MEAGSKLSRWNTLLKGLEPGLDALLITKAENRRYLSGFTGSSGWLFIHPERRAVVTDGRYWSQVGDQAPDWELIRFQAAEHGRLSRALQQWVSQGGWSGRVGFESDDVTVALHVQLEEDLPTLDLVPTRGLTEKLRQVKEPAEVEAVRRAAAAADRAFLTTMEQFREGIRECDLCAELEYQLQKAGARKPAFDSIVASGPNGAYPHAGVTRRAIGVGELVTLDFGALLDGYASDITRTVWLGALDPMSQRIYRVVREAQLKALEALRPGKTAAELDGVARRHIEDAGFGDAFRHSLGHGIGLAVHESPTLRSTVSTVLEAGMVVTVEPGIYLEGERGCRVEDTVVITDDGFEYLTAAPYQSLGASHPLESPAPAGGG